MEAKLRTDMLNKLLKSVLDQDLAPVVVCDMDDVIVYMNPSAIEQECKERLYSFILPTCRNVQKRFGMRCRCQISRKMVCRNVKVLFFESR